MIQRCGNANSRYQRRRPWRSELSRSSASVFALAWIYDWGNRAAWAAAGVSALLFFYAVVCAFPNARLIAMQQQDALERENRTFCEKHGMPFGTREHTLCAEGLMDIRANERQRTLDGLGIF
jgi:hypothetical protein